MFVGCLNLGVRDGHWRHYRRNIRFEDEISGPNVGTLLFAARLQCYRRPCATDARSVLHIELRRVKHSYTE